MLIWTPDERRVVLDDDGDARSPTRRRGSGGAARRRSAGRAAAERASPSGRRPPRPRGRSATARSVEAWETPTQTGIDARRRVDGRAQHRRPLVVAEPRGLAEDAEDRQPVDARRRARRRRAWGSTRCRARRRAGTASGRCSRPRAAPRCRPCASSRRWHRRSPRPDIRTTLYAGQRKTIAVPRSSAPRQTSSAPRHAAASARMSAIPRRPDRVAAASSIGAESRVVLDAQPDQARADGDATPAPCSPARAARRCRARAARPGTRPARPRAAAGRRRADRRLRLGTAVAPRSRPARRTGPRRARRATRSPRAAPSPRARSTAARAASTRPRPPPIRRSIASRSTVPPASAWASARRSDGRTSAWRSAARRPRSDLDRLVAPGVAARDELVDEHPEDAAARRPRRSRRRPRSSAGPRPGERRPQVAHEADRAQDADHAEPRPLRAARRRGRCRPSVRPQYRETQRRP